MGRSEKADKRLANRTLRARVRAQLTTHGDECPLPILREVSDPWCMSKDRKLRFDPQRYLQLMRK